MSTIVLRPNLSNASEFQRMNRINLQHQTSSSLLVASSMFIWQHKYRDCWRNGMREREFRALNENEIPCDSLQNVISFSMSTESFTFYKFNFGVCLRFWKKSYARDISTQIVTEADRLKNTINDRATVLEKSDIFAFFFRNMLMVC